jgi:membrane fusion protein, heavy metal efflux system
MERDMRSWAARGRVLVGVAVAVALCGGIGGAVWFLQQRKARAAVEAAPARAALAAQRPRRLDRDTLLIPPDLIRRLDVRTAQAEQPSRPRKLPPLQGRLALDNNRWVRARSPFSGEVVAIGSLAAAEVPDSAYSVAPRTLRPGDRVKKGDLLAVVWSKELGEKKSELVDALSKLRADRQTLIRLEELLREGATSERSVREAERNVEADAVAVRRAEQTLKTWRLSDDEITAIRGEAEKLRGATDRAARAEEWARVEVRAKQDGVILERNVNVGDLIDPSADLFKIGDLSRLVVWANIYDTDLPQLQELQSQEPPRPIPWRVQVPSRPGLSFGGSLEQIGAVIDPNQHTALASGVVDNPGGVLRVGEFVTATVELPPPEGEVEVPAAAVVEDGRESIVFVQPEPQQPRFVRKHVRVARRFHDVVYLKADGAESVRPGDWVVTAGSLLLRDALEELRPEEKR